MREVRGQPWRKLTASREVCQIVEYIMTKMVHAVECTPSTHAQDLPFTVQIYCRDGAQIDKCNITHLRFDQGIVDFLK